jgi:hypothetical protein
MPPDLDRIQNGEEGKSEIRRGVLPEFRICKCFKSKEIPRQDKSTDFKEDRVYKSEWDYWEESKQICMQPLSYLMQLVTLPAECTNMGAGSPSNSLEGIEEFLILLQGKSIGHSRDVIADQLHLVFLLYLISEGGRQLVGII